MLDKYKVDFIKNSNITTNNLLSSKELRKTIIRENFCLENFHKKLLELGCYLTKDEHFELNQSRVNMRKHKHTCSTIKIFCRNNHSNTYGIRKCGFCS